MQWSDFNQDSEKLAQDSNVPTMSLLEYENCGNQSEICKCASVRSVADKLEILYGDLGQATDLADNIEDREVVILSQKCECAALQSLFNLQ